MKNIVLAIRFLLEVTTVSGIIYGGFKQESILSKVFFILLGVILVVVWSQFGAPKSRYAFSGSYKLVLEIVVFGIGIICFYYLYKQTTATIYTSLVIVDLLLMYVLNLQGN